MLNNSNFQALFDQDFNLLSLLSGAIASPILVVFFVLFSVLECRFPREKLSTNNLSTSFKTNISLFIFNSMALSLLSVSTLLVLAEYYSDKWLLVYLPNPAWQVVVSFLLFELSLYI